MMYVFTMPADRWDEKDPDRTAILQLIQRHRAEALRLADLMRYYEGRHKILEDADRENRLVCNHAKDIAETATAYFIGNPITYNSNDDISALVEELDAAGADEADGDNGLDLAVYGRAYEYIYTKKDEASLAVRNLSPESTFVVYDDSIEQNELFAVYYYVRKDDSATTGQDSYIATVLTENYRWVFDIRQIPSQSSVLEGPDPHFKGEVPVVEYLNNKLGLGDYELQIPLIDAYNALMSDRITDKEQFIDAVLVLYGTLLADDGETDEGEDRSGAAMKRLARRKLLEMPGEGSRAEYLTRTYDEAGVEILKKALEQDIHKFSHVPCLTDEAFGGNVSGVAMEFKLLGLENITKIKTRYYRKGLRKRLRIFCGFLYTASRAVIDPAGITAEFTRAMPKNLLEISQYVNNLKGMVSKKTLLSQIPFVDDVEAELEAVEQEAEEAAQLQREIFGAEPNTPPERPEDTDREEEDVRERDDLTDEAE